MDRDADAHRGAASRLARDVEPATHLANQLAGLERPDAVAGRLGRAERTEQLVADERGGHAGAVILYLDDDVIAMAARRQPDPTDAAHRLNGVLDEMADRGRQQIG